MTPVQEWVQQTLHDNLVYSRDGGFRTIGVGDSHMNDGSLRYQGSRPIWGGGTGWFYRLGELLSPFGVRECQGGVGVTQPSTVGHHVWEAATGGNTSANYVTTGTLDNIGRIKPHLVIHSIGTNDHQTQIPTAVTTRNINDILRRIRGVAPEARQVFVMPWPVRNPANASYSWYDTEQAIRAALVDVPNVEVFEYGDLWQRLGQPFIPADPWNVMEDDIHGTNPMHRELAERMTEWFGLPSPAAAFSGLRPIIAEPLRDGKMNPGVAAGILEIPGLPIPRSVRVSVTALMAGTAPGDLHIRVNGTKGTSVLRPIQVSNLMLSSHSGEVVFDLQPRESATVRLTGDSGLFLYSGDWRNQYNEFKAEVTYV